MSNVHTRKENNYFVPSINWTIRLQRHGNLFVKINYLLSDSKNVSDLISYLRLLRITVRPLQRADSSTSTGGVES